MEGCADPSGAGRTWSLIWTIIAWLHITAITRSHRVQMASLQIRAHHPIVAALQYFRVQWNVSINRNLLHCKEEIRLLMQIVRNVERLNSSSACIIPEWFTQLPRVQKLCIEEICHQERRRKKILVCCVDTIQEQTDREQLEISLCFTTLRKVRKIVSKVTEIWTGPWNPHPPFAFLYLHEHAILKPEVQEYKPERFLVWW